MKLTYGKWFVRCGDWQLGRNDIGDYMHRWIAETPWGSLRIHHIMRSDVARALHDHPWSFWSLLLSGGYTEYTPEGPSWIPRWSLVKREAGALHRLVVDQPVWTLVWTGPRERRWGFVIDGVWTYWRVAERMWAHLPWGGQ